MESVSASVPTTLPKESIWSATTRATSVEKENSGTSMKTNGVSFTDEVELSKRLNELCRAQMRKRILSDILADLTVCEIEGWSKTEYIDELHELIDSLRE